VFLLINNPFLEMRDFKAELSLIVKQAKFDIEGGLEGGKL